MPSVSVNQSGRDTTVISSGGSAIISGVPTPAIALAETGLQGAPGPVGGLSNGDKGDVIVSGNGNILILDDIDGGTFN